MVSDATIVITQWQHFSETQKGLEALYAFTPQPLRLVYVDGNSPPSVRRYLEEQSRKRGFTLVRANRYLTSSEARNLSLPYVHTKYAAFLDNSATVTNGWLGAMIGCAEETGASVVEPLYCYGDAANPSIYSYAPGLHIEEADGKRQLIETAPLYRTRLADMRPSLERAEAGYAKFHCALIRTDILARLNAFDEGYTSYQDHRDFGLAVRQAGETIVCEPRAIVLLEDAPRLTWTDMPLYLLRWSNAWLRPSIRHFSRVWNLDESDDGLQGGTRFRNVRRRRFFSGARKLARAIGGWRAVAVVDAGIDAFFDRVVEALIVARLERRRRAAMPPGREPRLRTILEAESDG